MNIMSGNDGRTTQNGGSAEAKPFIGINFKCCGIYCRIYKNKAQTAYEGSCPKCRKKVKLPIGTGGTSCRFFDVE